MSSDEADGGTVPSGPMTEVQVQEQVVLSGGSREEEFTAFVNVAGGPLRQTAYLLCGDAGRADELSQEALLRVWTHWDSARSGEPLAYARRVLVNLRIDAWRRSRRDASRPRDEPQPDPALAVARRDQIVRALRRLPPQQRRAVVLRHLLDLSESQTATDLGTSVGAVKSNTSRGMTRLRELLTEEDQT